MLPIKRQLNELIAIYQLEEKLIDIYLEGPDDRFIIENYLEFKKVEKTCIEIDSIDFSEERYKYNDLNLFSNQEKLIALSRVLIENKVSASVTCIIDRDFHGILSSLEVNKHLLYTDYCCMESYLLSKKFIEKILKIGIKNFPITSDIVIQQIGYILQSLFIIRMINKKFSLNLALPKIENHFKVEKKTGNTDFSFDTYLDKFISANNLVKSKPEILKFVKDITASLNGDIRFQLNGHDFITVLFNYINKVKNTPNFKLDNFENAFRLAVQPDHLVDYPLFNNITL